MIRTGLFVIAAALVVIAPAAWAGLVVVEWAPASGPVAFYQVEKSLDGGPFVIAGWTPADSSCREAVIDCPAPQILRVRVRARAADGAIGPPSVPSQPIVCVPEPGALGLIAGLAFLWAVSHARA